MTFRGYAQHSPRSYEAIIRPLEQQKFWNWGWPVRVLG